MRLMLEELEVLVASELRSAGANEAMAHATARALVLAQSQ